MDRFPGNAEVCDSIDNDCDGVVDEGLSFDADGDGHTTLASCAGTQDDCADGDPQNFGGNTEVCDGSDNNCDAVIDEGFAESFGEGRRIEIARNREHGKNVKSETIEERRGAILDRGRSQAG